VRKPKNAMIAASEMRITRFMRFSSPEFLPRR
jgi:hypothetical protein